MVKPIIYIAIACACIGFMMHVIQLRYEKCSDVLRPKTVEVFGKQYICVGNLL